jgi:hypothetical protein
MKKDLPFFTTSRLILKAVTIEDPPAYQKHFFRLLRIPVLTDRPFRQ